ncbi:MAG: DUF960 domain-containing protein [Clostridium sp.]|nr:DUF960 domain-containing protein [Clostridium sp.]
MFKSKRYLTQGVQSEIPIELQLFMWECIDSLPEPKDYFQVFRFRVVEGLQCITHITEAPEYRKKYKFASQNPITAKVYVIDDETHTIMLLAKEY